MITIRQIYDAYPNSDLLPIDPDTVTLDELVDCGDTLFLFLCRELTEEEVSLSEAADRAYRAVEDCQKVADALAALAATTPDG